MNNCKTCKHRSANPGYSLDNLTVYDCARMPMLWNATAWVETDDGDVVLRLASEYAGQKAFVQDGNDYSASLLVTDDFGCVMHEPV